MRRSLLLLLASCLSALPLGAAERRPNVIFIITDDQRREEIGYLGGKVLTPHLDRIAMEGTRFTCGTVCTPSRYACITGRYPSRCSARACTNARVSHIGGPPGGNFLVRLTMRAKPPYLANYFDPDQLYDLRKDPTETTNLAQDSEHAARLEEMQNLLRGFLADLPGSFADLKPTAEPP